MKGKKILTLLSCVFVVFVFMASPANVQASEFQVPSVYPTIQAGIDAAAAGAGGGIVRVAPGTYSVASGEIFPIILTDGVELIGAGAAVCTLDATGFYTEVIRCPDATPTRIEGFTIVNGDGYLGGGIACYSGSFPVIVNNFIIDNNARSGGGIVCHPDSFPSIINNIFMGNYAFYGGAIYCHTASAPMIINNTIVGNSAVYGAGIYCYTNSSGATIANNIINQNTVTSLGAGIYCRFSSPFIDYNSVYDNIRSSDSLPQDYYGCIRGPNDISVDPEFVDSGAGDYHLQSYSFCVDAGTNDFLWLVNFDFEGNPRPLDGDGSERVDIGADEVVPLPVADAGSDQNVSADADCQATVTLDGTDSDDLGGGDLTYTWTGPLGDADGTEPTITVTLGLGEHTFTLTVSNVNGTGTDEVVITVEDTTPPELAQPSLPDVTGECSAEITTYPTATDTCSEDIITGTTEDPLFYDEQGTYTVTWTFDDGNGNTVTQTQRVIVQDVTAPDPDVATLPTVEGICSAIIETAPTATDNCSSSSIEGTTTDPLSYTDQGIHTVTWTFDDGNGNTATQTQTVIVQDVTAPVPNVAALLDVSGECSAVIETAPTATDNCTGSIPGTTSDPLSYTEHGTYTVTWTFDDGNGNTATQTQTVIVQDVTAPVPNVAALLDVSGECSAVIETAPTATDNCTGSIPGTTSDPLSYTEHGTHTVTWTYDDGNGNTATQTQTVTVEDVTPPEIHLSDPACVEIKKWKLANMLTVSAQDNCSSNVEWTIDKVEIFNRGGRRVRGRGVYSVNGSNIFVYPRGRDWSVRVTVTAADASGNTKTEQISKSLLRCNRMSEQMARWLRWLFYLMWKMGCCR